MKTYRVLVTRNTNESAEVLVTVADQSDVNEAAMIVCKQNPELCHFSPDEVCPRWLSYYIGDPEHIEAVYEPYGLSLPVRFCPGCGEQLVGRGLVHLFYSIPGETRWCVARVDHQGNILKPIATDNPGLADDLLECAQDLGCFTDRIECGFCERQIWRADG